MLVVLFLTASFIGLGIWQLQRAQELNAHKKIPIDQKIYPLEQMATPTGIIPAASVGKFVTTSGHFIANYKAPNQIDGDGKVSDWEVGLLQNDRGSAILVVRGLWSDRFLASDVVMSTNVEITGTLLPHQSKDRAAQSSMQLSRLDSSLLVATTQVQLYYGFILANAEKSRNGAIKRSVISAPELVSAVPGYYWQHISYVVIWWFMALLILWLPFYRRGQ